MSAGAGTSRPFASGLLLGLALLLVVVAAVLFAGGAEGSPGTAGSASLSQRHSAVIAAARAETLAFLTVDYRDMDPLVDEVLDGATGDFAEEYAQARDQLVAKARAGRSVSTGEVRAAGVAELGETSAVVYVAADGTVTSTSTDGKAQVRPYRFRLGLVREDGRWLTSELRILD